MSGPGKHSPPSWATHILKWFCDPYLLEDLEGDLYERFHERLQNSSAWKAKLFYIMDVLRFIRPYTWRKTRSITTTFILLRNYSVTALRNASKYKLYTGLNIMGLATGLSCFILISLYVEDEQKFDRHYDKAERIFQVTTKVKSPATNPHIAWTDAYLGQQVKESYPEVEDAVALLPMQRTATLRIGKEVFSERGIYWAEPSYFHVFSHPFLAGNATTALANPYCIVLTRTLADKFFPHQDALNKTITIGQEDYKVSAVIEDLPDHTDMKFKALLSIEGESIYEVNEWSYTYLLFKDKKYAENFERKLQNIYRENLGLELREYDAEATYVLEPLPSVHFGEKKLFDTPKSNYSNLYIFSAIACLILILACINYINLSLAQVSNRNIEVGVRKVMGALPGQIRSQYLIESFFMACCATIIAVGMSIYLLPLLNQIAHKDIHFTAILSWHFLLLITLVLSLVALLSGSYPALYLSSKNVITSLRGHFTSTPGGLRNFLLAFQFMICIALIACTRIVFDQMKLLTQTHPGFDKEQVLVVDIPYDPTLWANMKAIKNVMKELPEVKSVSLIGNNSMPTSDLDIDTYDVYEEGEWKTKALNNISVDEEFLSLLGVPIIQGRNFRQEDFVNEESVAIVNASMVKTMHWEDPLTEKIFNGDAALKIVGVVNDFHFHGFHKQVEPIIIQLDNQYPEKLLIKVTRSDFNTIVKIEDTWKKMVKDHPFEFDFLDNFFNDQYHSERTMQTLLSYFSILTLVVASLGLFGLLAILTAQRTKEFGIRKVFGANLAHLLLLLCKPFIILLLAGTALAIPLTIYFMQLWLQRFSTQITIGATPFLIASFTAMLLILLCMLYHAIHSYRSKTLHALRYE